MRTVGRDHGNPAHQADRSVRPIIHIGQWELIKVARLTNSKLRRKSLKGCRAGDVTATEAWGFIDAARQSGDRRLVGRIRRAMGA